MNIKKFLLNKRDHIKPDDIPLIRFLGWMLIIIAVGTIVIILRG